MHLNAKKITFLGLLLALTVIFVILSGVLEMNTLFLLAAASFGVGIAIRECGLRLGAGFYAGAILLSILLAPNKLYCITFGGMGLYLIVIEFIWLKLGKIPISNSKKKAAFWLAKYALFNLIYIPMLLLFPKLIYTGNIAAGILILLLAAGQLFLFLYDTAYEYFQKYIWGKFRNTILKL